MAKTRYRVSICTGDACREVGRMTTNIARAKARLLKAVEKERRALLKASDEGTVSGEIRSIERGIVSEAPLYEASASYGEPRRRGKGRAAARPRSRQAIPLGLPPPEELAD